MNNEKKDEILSELKLKLLCLVCDTLRWPQAYCDNPQKVKAIVLGCDPSNKNSHNLKYAFGINTNVPRLKGFFKSIETNLHEIGLGKEVVYVQNLCQNYFRDETGKNPRWKDAAAICIPYLNEELAVLPDSVPVFLTAEILYRVLLKDGIRPKSASYLYSHPVEALIPPSQNKLGRVLFPFYRFDRGERSYHLSKENYRPYRMALSKRFDTSIKRQVKDITIEVVEDRELT